MKQFQTGATGTTCSRAPQTQATALLGTIQFFFCWGNQHHATNAVDCTEPGIFFQAAGCNVEQTMIIKSLTPRNCLRSTSKNIVTLKCYTVSAVVTVADWGEENVLSLQYTGAVSGLSGRQRALQAADERDAHPRNTKTKAS